MVAVSVLVQVDSGVVTSPVKMTSEMTMVTPVRSRDAGTSVTPPGVVHRAVGGDICGVSVQDAATQVSTRNFLYWASCP